MTKVPYLVRIDGSIDWEPDDEDWQAFSEQVKEASGGISHDDE